MKKIMFIAVAAGILSACSSIDTVPGAEKVIVSPNKPPKDCKFVTQVSGNQGNMFTGGWTSNKNMAVGAMNDLRNQAVKAGANYVQLLTNQAGGTGGGGFNTGAYQQTNVTDLGNAYACPESAIGE